MGPGRTARAVVATVATVGIGMVLMANFVTRLVTSALNYWLGFMVDFTVAGFFLAHTLTYLHRPLLISCLVVLAGLGLYGLMEYVFHRWIYHGRRSPAATGHLLHHVNPQAPIAVPFFFPAMAAVILWFLFRPVLGEGEASLMVAVLVSNFVYYGLLHHCQHHGRLKVRYFLGIRRHHLIHHHFPDRNFGLTTTLWDWVFGTHHLSARDLRTGEASI